MNPVLKLMVNYYTVQVILPLRWILLIHSSSEGVFPRGSEHFMAKGCDVARKEVCSYNTADVWRWKCDNKMLIPLQSSPTPQLTLCHVHS